MYERVYFGVCVFVTIVLTLWCVYEYMLDPEVSNIRLRKFHETLDDLQPSITLCVKDPLEINRSLIRTHFVKLLDLYQKYMGGRPGEYDFDDKLLSELQKLDYDNVTSSLSDILSLFSVYFLSNIDEAVTADYSVKEEFLVANEMNKVYEDYPQLTKKSLEQIPIYISARNDIFKCYTFDIPWIQGVSIKKIEIEMNATFASMGDSRIALGKYFLLLTYPNQTLQVPPGKRIELNKHDQIADCYSFKLKTGAMEVYHRRDKSEKRCNINWKNHDHMFMNYVIEKSGCNPKHWNIKSNLDYCNSSEQHQTIRRNFMKIGAFMPPCRSIELFSIETDGHNPGWRCPRNNPYFKLRIYLDKEMFYKEISEVKAYTFQSLIGNSGNLLIFFLNFSNFNFIIFQTYQ